MFNWVLNSPIVSTIKWHTLYLQKKWTFRKSELYVKIHCIGLKWVDGKLEVTDFKHDNEFSLKLQPKDT